MTDTTTIILMLYFIRGSLGHVLQQSPIVGIAGGYPVNIEDAPFMAALLDVDTHTNNTVLRCGGSIIHKQFVLTTASCINIYHKNNPLIVRVGSSHYDEGGTLHEVEKYISHESYYPSNNVNNNVALLKLSEPVTFGPSVAMIHLADDHSNIPTGLYADVTGWGEIRYGADDEPSRYLQQVSLSVSPHDECGQFYDWMKFTDKQICVINVRRGACFSDAGGPLIAGDLQIGIASYTDNCSPSLEVVVVGVYEKVAPHLQWIRHKIKQNL